MWPPANDLHQARLVPISSSTHRHHPHPDHDDDQMRQRLAQLEARLGQLRPEEPRPPSSPSDSIGEHLNVEEYFQK